MLQTKGTPSIFEFLGERGKTYFAETGRTIFKQGSLGSSFFVIKEGSVELQFDGFTRRILRAGDFFGEIRALGDLPRTATATCLSGCRLVELNPGELDELIHSYPLLRKMIVQKYGARLLHSRTRSHEQMSKIADSAYEKIVSAFEHLIVPEGQFLFCKGEPSEMIYLILRGKILIKEDDKILAKREAGEFVGEVGALRGKPRSAAGFAEETAELLQCPVDKLNDLLARYPAFQSYLTQLVAQRMRSTLRLAPSSFIG